MNNTTSKAYENLKPIEGKLLDNILESNNDVYLTKKEDIINEIIKIVKDAGTKPQRFYEVGYCKNERQWFKNKR